MTRRASAFRSRSPAAISLAVVWIVLAGCSSAPGPTGPDGESLAPAATPVVACGLVSDSELTEIFHVQLHPNDTGSRSCTWTATGGLPSVNLRFQPGDLAKAHDRLQNPQNMTVLGNPAVIGGEFGLSLYVQTGGGEDLVIQSVLLDDTTSNRSKLVAVAQAALSRLPSTAG